MLYLMRITNLTVDNFRNHTHSTLQLTAGINVLVGPNAQGKTNLLEAVYLSCVGRGWRTVRDSEMVQFGKGAIAYLLPVRKGLDELIQPLPPEVGR